MPIQDLDPRAAHQAMSQDALHVLLDVRTVEEFERGHPAGALNIPWAVIDPASGRMAHNPEFLPTVQKHVGTDSAIYASCQSGVRSMNACKELEQAGYARLVNVRSGYGGKRDPAGTVIDPGWHELGLPTDSTPSTYSELRG
jgi:rhodanese-related sulfurtransferase